MIELWNDQHMVQSIKAGRLPFSLALESAGVAISLILDYLECDPPVLLRIQPSRIADNGEQDRTWACNGVAARGGGDEIGDG